MGEKERELWEMAKAEGLMKPPAPVEAAASSRIEEDSSTGKVEREVGD